VKVSKQLSEVAKKVNQIFGIINNYDRICTVDIAKYYYNVH